MNLMGMIDFGVDKSTASILQKLYVMALWKFDAKIYIYKGILH